MTLQRSSIFIEFGNRRSCLFIHCSSFSKLVGRFNTSPILYRNETMRPSQNKTQWILMDESLDEARTFFRTWLIHPEFSLLSGRHKSNESLGTTRSILDCKWVHLELAAFTSLGVDWNVETRYFNKSSGRKILKNRANICCHFFNDSFSLVSYLTRMVRIYLHRS